MSKDKKAKKEGRRIRTLPPMQYVALYLMKTRAGSTNYFSDRMDVAVAEQYINEKRAQGMKEFSMMHLFLSALVRLYSQHPEINRFVRGRRIYARNGIQVCITVKKQLTLDAPDTVVKFDFKPEYTADQVYEQVTSAIDEALSAPSDFDDVAKTLNKVPRCIMRLAVWGLECMDYFGILPKSLRAVSPFHGSAYITSMASLGIPPIYHHLYEFGNIPLFFAFGRRYSEYVIQPDATAKKVKYMDYRISCDERAVDGHAYSVALRYFNSLLRNPYLLDNPPEAVKEDIP